MDIIGLLNDFGGDIRDEVFIGENGEPTDHFLEALKSGGSKVGAGAGEGARGRTTVASVSVSAPVMKRSNSANRDRVAVNTSSSAGSQPRTRKSTGASTITAAVAGKGTSKFAKEGDKDTTRDSRDKPLVVNQKAFYGAPRASRAASLRIQDGEMRAAEAEHKSRANNSKAGLAFAVRQNKPKKIVAGPSAAVKRQAMAAALLSGGATPFNTSVTSGGGGGGVNQSSHNHGQNRTRDRDGEGSDYGSDGETQDQSLIYEGRERTLQLRLSGQQQALRAVEMQLQEALTLLEARTRQLSHAEGRTKAMRRELDIAQRKAQVRTLERERVVEAKRGDLLEECRAHAELVQAQLTEEQARRRRTDDRARVLKEFGDKTKARALELETTLAELVSANSDTRASLLRSKTENRDMQNEMTLLKASLAEQQEEVARQRARAENAEYLHRNMRLDGERLREELAAHRREVSAMKDHQQRTHSELDLLRQRYATLNAEARMLERGGVAPPLPPPHIHTQAQARSSSSAPAAHAHNKSRDTSRTEARSEGRNSSRVPYGGEDANNNETDRSVFNAEPVAFSGREKDTKRQSVYSVAASSSSSSVNVNTSLDREKTSGSTRRMQPHYSLPPPIASSNGPIKSTSRGPGVTTNVGAGRGSNEMTAMGIKRRVQSSFLLDDDTDDEEEVSSSSSSSALHTGVVMGLSHASHAGTHNRQQGDSGTSAVRRSASSLEEALVTQNLGPPLPVGANTNTDDIEVGDYENDDDDAEVDSLDDDGDGEGEQALRRVAMGLQADAQAAAHSAEQSLRSSLESLQMLQSAGTSSASSNATEEAKVLERFQKLQAMHEKLTK